MRVLILGGSGMLGHKVCQQLRDDFEAYATFRRDVTSYEGLSVFHGVRLISGIHAANFDSVVSAVASVRPDIIANCIGIVKQIDEARDPIISILINSLFPHRLATLCRAVGCHLVHFSTDCVFSGSRGAYTETDIPDASDLYGRSKALGEVTGEGCLTIRTSIIGRELRSRHGLLEWLLSAEGKMIQGYSQAIFSGLTTIAVGDILKQVLLNYPELEGLYHISSPPISKYDLLLRLRDAYGLTVTIQPESTVRYDRSLDSAKFFSQVSIQRPEWDKMISELVQDPTNYTDGR